MDIMANPKGYVIKKFMFEILKERYPKHEDFLERVGHFIVTDSDIEAFRKFIVDIYEIAYLKAVEDHREQLAKAGLKVKIVPEVKKKDDS